MHEDSQAYKDAWKRVRDALEQELPLLSSADLDDAACVAVHAAFGIVS